MNKIELVTLRHSLDCEAARLAYERFRATRTVSDDASAQEEASEKYSLLLDAVSVRCRAVDLLLSLKTAPGPDLPEEEYRAHATAQMLLDMSSTLYCHLDDTLEDDDVLSDTTRCRVDALRQELVLERIDVTATELEPLIRQLSIPNLENCASALLEDLNRHLSAESGFSVQFSEQAVEMERQNLPSHAGQLRKMAGRHETHAAQLRECIASLNDINGSCRS